MKSDVILQALQNLIAASDGVLSGTQFKDALDAARAALKAPAERKIVQIQIIKSEYGNAVPSITALCNDGTLWVRTNNHWYQIDGIPEQPEQTSGCSSMCYPLAIQNLMTRALNQAFELGERRVTADAVGGL